MSEQLTNSNFLVIYSESRFLGMEEWATVSSCNC